MTEEEMKNHKTLERAFLYSKQTRNRLKKRVKNMQDIINRQNEAIKRKDNFIKKILEENKILKSGNGMTNKWNEDLGGSQ